VVWDYLKDLHPVKQDIYSCESVVNWSFHTLQSFVATKHAITRAPVDGYLANDANDQQCSGGGHMIMVYSQKATRAHEAFAE